MPIEKTPYEFMVRFKKDGAISGAHIKFFETISEGGVVLLEREGRAEPVETASEAGFPMASVLDAIHVGAIVAFDAEVAAHAATALEKEAEIQAAKNAEIQAQADATAVLNNARADATAVLNDARAAYLLLQQGYDNEKIAHTNTTVARMQLQQQLAAEVSAHAATSARLSALENQLAATPKG